MQKTFQRFFAGATEGWHEEGKAIASVNDLAILPIASAIAGYNYLKENEGKDINPVFAVLSMAGIAFSPIAAATIPAGLIVDTALLTTCPFYMFYKGCRNLVNKTDRDLSNFTSHREFESADYSLFQSRRLSTCSQDSGVP